MSKRSLFAKMGVAVAAAGLLAAGLTAPSQAAGTQPNWQLPFQDGQVWKANAPHHDEGEKGTASSWSSIDFGPSAGSNWKVVSVAAGKVFKKTCGSNWYLGIDHGNGWKTSYYHLTNVQSGLVGKTVPAGTYLGQAGTATPCGGSASSPQVHLTIYKDGKLTNINNFRFGNYKVGTGSETYVGKWMHADGRLAFNVPWPGYMVGALKSTTRSGPPLKALSSSTPTVNASKSAPATLSASRGAWGPSGVQLTNQWLLKGVNISGATGGTYTIKASDFGKKIQVRVTGTKAGYATKSTSSKEVFAAKVVNRPGWTYVNMRANPTAASTYLGRINGGKMAAVQCHVQGQRVQGPYGTSTIWYRIPGAGWVADALLETNSNNPVVPKC